MTPACREMQLHVLRQRWLIVYMTSFSVQLAAWIFTPVLTLNGLVLPWQVPICVAACGGSSGIHKTPALSSHSPGMHCSPTALAHTSQHPQLSRTVPPGQSTGCSQLARSQVPQDSNSTSKGLLANPLHRRSRRMEKWRDLPV